jgi:16S rRNA processing protein RimM
VPEDWFAIGRTVRVHGLKGCLKATSYLESDRLLRDLDEILLGGEEEGGSPFKVRNIETRGKEFLLQVEGIEDADAAERWVGFRIMAPVSKLKPLPEGEYYWRDLVGLSVVTEEGRRLGRIEEVFPTGSNDVYVCRGEEGEFLLPALADVIRSVDIGKGLMVVRLYKGL